MRLRLVKKSAMVQRKRLILRQNLPSRWIAQVLNLKKRKRWRNRRREINLRKSNLRVREEGQNLTTDPGPLLRKDMYGKDLPLGTGLVVTKNRHRDLLTDPGGQDLLTSRGDQSPEKDRRKIEGGPGQHREKELKKKERGRYPETGQRKKEKDPDRCPGKESRRRGKGRDPVLGKDRRKKELDPNLRKGPRKKGLDQNPGKE